MINKISYLLFVANTQQGTQDETWFLVPFHSEIKQLTQKHQGTQIKQDKRTKSG